MHPLSNEYKLKQIWNFFDKNLICILQFLTKSQLNHSRWSVPKIFFCNSDVIWDVESEFVIRNSYFLGKKGENCKRKLISAIWWSKWCAKTLPINPSGRYFQGQQYQTIFNMSLLISTEIWFFKTDWWC